MKLVITILVTVVLGIPQSPAPPQFELRVAETNPGEGLIETQLESTDEKVYLGREPVLTNRDVAGATAVESRYRPGTFNIEVLLNEEGSRKLAITTESRIGKRIAILVDGKVLATPVVESRISSRAMITGGFTKGEAERIANGISVRSQK